MAKKEKNKSSLSTSMKIAIFMLLLLAVLFFPTTVLFCAGLLPTLIAAIVDDRPQKTAWMTVGAMNFAGIVPAWFDLWHAGHGLADAFEILSQPRTIIIAYGAAAVGWGIFFQVPKIIVAFMVRRAENRMRDIEKRKRELARKWGVEVGGDYKYN